MALVIGGVPSSRVAKLLLVVSGRVLEKFGTIEQTGSWRVEWTSDSQDALQRIETAAPAMLIVSAALRKPPPNGFDLCRRLRALSPQSASLLVLPRGPIEVRLSAFDASADDCLEEPFDIRELAARSNALARRGGFGPLFAVAAPATTAPRGSGSDVMRSRAAALARRRGLSPREGQILALLGAGVAPKAIGSNLGCGHATVRTHLRRIGLKLGCAGTQEILLRLFSVEP